jgi:hypothetical protein
MKNRTLYLGLFSACLSVLSLSFSARAQPGSGGPAPAVVVPTETPIDGGASLLLAAGAAYGLRRLRQRRKS